MTASVSTDAPHCLVEKRGHVLIVTLNRPQARNALSLEMMATMREAWDQVDADLLRYRVCVDRQPRGRRLRVKLQDGEGVRLLVREDRDVGTEVFFAWMAEPNERPNEVAFERVRKALRVIPEGLARALFHDLSFRS